MPPTRRRLGCRPAARPAGQEPAFRADPTSERNDLPVRNARFPIRANGKPRRAAIPATCRKTREKKRDEFPGYCIRPETYHAPGRQNRKCGRGESGASASSGARKARATGLRVTQDRSFPTETPDEPGISVKPDYTLCYTSRSRRCFRLILPDGWKPSGMEPAGKCLHLAHSVY